MSELEKFKQLFDEVGIKYNEEKFFGNTTVLSIDKQHIMKTYDNSIDIEFDTDDGRFVRFVAQGGD